MIFGIEEEEEEESVQLRYTRNSVYELAQENGITYNEMLEVLEMEKKIKKMQTQKGFREPHRARSRANKKVKIDVLPRFSM
jgi:Ni,Fe-hydrogenase I large subunit